MYSSSFEFDTGGEFDFVDLTSEVNRVVQDSGIQNGIVLVFAGHATGVIVVTELEFRLRRDIQDFLARFVPSKGDYHHSANAFAHLRSMFLAPSKVLPVRNGRAALGTWQTVFWIEAETRPRHRTVEVYAIGTKGESG